MDTGNNIRIFLNYSLDFNEYQFLSNKFNYYIVTSLNISTFSWNFNCIEYQWISIYFNKKNLLYFNTHTFQCISTHLFQQYFIELNKRDKMFQRISILFEHHFSNEFHQSYLNWISTQFERWTISTLWFQHDFNAQVHWWPLFSVASQRDRIYNCVPRYKA